MAQPLIIIAAMSRNRVIGIENRLPWRLPDDLQHFKKITLDQTILMGRKTWESLPGLLPRRKHLVLTRNADYQAKGAIVIDSIEKAQSHVEQGSALFVVGGANLYEQLLPHCETMYLTLVDADIEGDAWFPQWNNAEWVEMHREHHAIDDRHAYAFDFVTLKRKAV